MVSTRLARTPRFDGEKMSLGSVAEGREHQLGGSTPKHFVSVLLILSAMKFWFVAMFYMHLKFDIKILSWLFGFSLMIAFVVICALFVLFTYNRTLWWWSGTW